MRDDAHKQMLEITSDISLNDFLKRFAGKGVLRPQTYWLKNFSGSIPFDYIGKFENLQNDFDICCQKLNIDPTRLSHKKMGDGTSYKDVYDVNSINIIDEVYRDEIEIFGYSCS